MSKALILLRRYRKDGIDPVSRGAMSRGDTHLGPASALVDHYRGMDGVPVSLVASSPSGGLGSWASLDELELYRNSSAENLDLICVVPMPLKPLNRILVPGFDFCGYDCGVFASSTNVYSVIFHEVLFGKLPELVRYAVGLNRRYLFEEWDDAASLMAARQRLSRFAGGSLENFAFADNPGVFAVFEAPRHC